VGGGKKWEKNYVKLRDKVQKKKDLAIPGETERKLRVRKRGGEDDTIVDGSGGVGMGSNTVIWETNGARERE